MGFIVNPSQYRKGSFSSITITVRPRYGDAWCMALEMMGVPGICLLPLILVVECFDVPAAGGAACFFPVARSTGTSWITWLGGSWKWIVGCLSRSRAIIPRGLCKSRGGLTRNIRSRCSAKFCPSLSRSGLGLAVVACGDDGQAGC